MRGYSLHNNDKKQTHGKKAKKGTIFQRKTNLTILIRKIFNGNYVFTVRYSSINCWRFRRQQNRKREHDYCKRWTFCKENLGNNKIKKRNNYCKDPKRRKSTFCKEVFLSVESLGTLTVQYRYLFVKYPSDTLFVHSVHCTGIFRGKNMMLITKSDKYHCFFSVRPILSNLERQDVAASQTLRAAFSKVSTVNCY